MKIRNGFVSNLSTSSFLIYGVEIGEDELYDALDEALNGSSLEHHHPEGCEFYVGNWRRPDGEAVQGRGREGIEGEGWDKGEVRDSRVRLAGRLIKRRKP